jgi:dTDP-4-dehydrorhamnose reductase
MIRNLVIGSSGQVGEEVCKILSTKKNHTFTPTYFKNKSDYIKYKTPIKFDLNNIDEDVLNNNYDIIWLCGANTFVDKIEDSEDNENFNGPKNIIDICNKLDKKPLIIFLSTDYIYDGNDGPYKEFHKPNPINKYGVQKLEAEKYIRANYNRFIIIRTTWVYGPQLNGTNFVVRLAKYLQEGNKAFIPFDEFSTPTYSEDIPKAVLHIIKQNDYMDKQKINLILNIAGSDLVSKYEFAKTICEKFKLNDKLLKPKISSEILRSAKRPLKSGLDISKLLSNNYKPLNIEEGLNKILKG